MRKESLEGMTLKDIDSYGKSIGMDVTGKKSKKAKIDELMKFRGRKVTVSLLGHDFEILMKRLADKRLADLQGKEWTDQHIYDALKLILGDEQYEKLMSIATDEDGTVDSQALGFAFGQILRSTAVKNS